MLMIRADSTNGNELHRCHVSLPDDANSGLLLVHVHYIHIGGCSIKRLNLVETARGSLHNPIIGSVPMYSFRRPSTSFPRRGITRHGNGNGDLDRWGCVIYKISSDFIELGLTHDMSDVPTN